MERTFSAAAPVQSRLHTAGAVCAGALTLVWPALLNRYPLLYPDSVEYVEDGRKVLHGLLHGPDPHLGGMRSPLYSLAILPLHCGRTPWPVLVLQALVMAYVLWLVVRAVALHTTVLRYVALVAALSLLTSASWYASLLMPDVFGAAAYLGMLLLVFAREALSRWEQVSLAAIVLFGLTAHITHLMLGLVLGAVLVLLYAVLRRGAMRACGCGVVIVAALLLFAVIAQTAANKRLYGVWALNVKRPPYLMARMVADGPAREYLQAHCTELHWAVCARAARLPNDNNVFLWEHAGPWADADEAAQDEIRREQMPLALATVRTFPREVIASTLRGTWEQLLDFGVDDFDTNTYLEDSLDNAMPGARARYMRSLQARNAVPSGVFTRIQQMTVAISLVVLAFVAPWLWRRRGRAPEQILLWMAALLLPLLVVNAMITGPVSEVDSRFEARVIWVAPLLAMLAVMLWREQRQHRSD